MGYSLFDIAGPIMVGPSSSHTAGAARIGQFARAIFDGTPSSVHFFLHGSFGEVYAGHATDRALLGGMLKFPPNNPGIKESFEIAERQGLKYEFEPGDMGDEYHPNTVKISMENENGKLAITGSSIGGGNIEIVEINDYPVHLMGNSSELFFTLVMEMDNEPGMLARIAKLLRDKGYHIEDMQSSYLEEIDKLLTVMSLEEKLTLQEVLDLEKEPGMVFVRSLEKLSS